MNLSFLHITLGFLALHRCQQARANALDSAFREGEFDSTKRELTTKKGKAPKKGKRGKSSTLTGRYSGTDTEDGTNQVVTLLCDEDSCDILLRDVSFSTCFEITGGGFFGLGIAVAKDVPQDELDNFVLPLYCKAQDELEIDFNKDPDAFLTGNIVILPEGGLFRSGPGFYYYKVSDPSIKNLTSKKPKNKHKGKKNHEVDQLVDINGIYRGADTEDGSGQWLTIFCNRYESCDLILHDPSFSTCSGITGVNLFRGVGLATNIHRDSLNDFDIKLYCLGTDELVVDPTRAPDAILTGNLASLQDGILSRTGPGFTYYESLNPASFAKNFAQTLSGIDTEDGSTQALTIRCLVGLCDITLQDVSFSTCIENISGDRFAGGLALAQNIPQESLDSFTLDLYCVDSLDEVRDGINYEAGPVTTLDGSLIVLEDGIIRRTGTGFTYYNGFWDEVSSDRSGKGHPGTSITNGSYQGTKYRDGSADRVIPSCFDGTCQVVLQNAIFTECIIPETNFNPVFNGFGIAVGVPEDSLNNFDIKVFCRGVGATVDIEVDDPTFMINGFGLEPTFPSGAILRKQAPTGGFIYYKRSSE